MASLRNKILLHLRKYPIYTDHVPALGARPRIVLACLEEMEIEGRVVSRQTVSRNGGKCTVYERTSE